MERLGFVESDVRRAHGVSVAAVCALELTSA
jgi:hypothetical protein